MHSIPRFAPKVRLLCLPLGLVVAMAAGTAAGAGEERGAPAKVVVVGKATINWHLDAGPASEPLAKLLERYRQVTEAHLTGGELPKPADDSEPGAPVSLANGAWGVRLPAELVSTMFVDAEGDPYCAESLTMKAAETLAAPGETADAQP